MKEPLTHFVRQGEQRWAALRAGVERSARERLTLPQIRELDALYRQVAGDLARAQAFYPGTDAERFLHDLCGQAYHRLYQPPRGRMERVIRFYRSELPQLVRAEKHFILLSAFIFGLSLAVGALLVATDPHGAQLLVPPDLRNHIKRHDMWTDSILTTVPPNVVAATIATNNLTVTILAFASGVLLGLGPLYILLLNGLHIGSLVMFCAQHEMAPKLLDFVSAHGPVELSIIVIAGGAGFMLGHALLIPKDLTRMEALRERGRRAVALVVGCAPFLAAIGIVEGFISPGDFFPTSAKAVLGLALGALLWGYLLLAGTSPSAARRSR